MNPSTKKLVFTVEDLMTKDKKSVAVVSLDVHYFRDHKEKVEYASLMNQAEGEKNELKQKELLAKAKNHLTIASGQFLLDGHKEFARQIKSLTAEAIKLREEQLNKK